MGSLEDAPPRKVPEAPPSPPRLEDGELCACNTRHLDASTFSLENAFRRCQNFPSSSSSPETPVSLEGEKKKRKQNPPGRRASERPSNGNQMDHFSAENLHELGNGRGCRKRAGRAVEKKNHFKMLP